MPYLNLPAAGVANPRRRPSRRVLIVTAGLAVAVIVIVALLPTPASRPHPGSPAEGNQPRPSPSTAQPNCPPPPSQVPAPDGRRVTVELLTNISAEQEVAIEGRLRALPELSSVTFISKQEAYQTFLTIYCSHPDLIAVTKPDVLAASFIVVVRDPNSVATVRDAVAGMSGVATVIGR